MPMINSIKHNTLKVLPLFLLKTQQPQSELIIIGPIPNNISHLYNTFAVTLIWMLYDKYYTSNSIWNTRQYSKKGTKLKTYFE